MVENKRKNIPPSLQVQIWQRDHWHCRYCGAPVFFAQTLKCLEDLNPGHGYYHKNTSYKKMLKPFAQYWINSDHVVPVKEGGDNSIGNLVTACWKCNPSFSDKKVGEGKDAPYSEEEHLKRIVIKEWDGLSGLYPKLAKKEDVWTKLLKK